MIRRPIRSGRRTDVGAGPRTPFGLRPAAVRAGGVRDARRRCSPARRRCARPGYKNLDTHTPFPIHGLEEALGLKRPKIPLIVLCGAIAGACIAYSLIYFCNVIDWPLNIGNRPPHGPPANIPITFELAVLLGGGSSFIGLLRAGEAAAALSPGLRVGGFSARVRRRVLPVGRAAGGHRRRSRAGGHPHRGRAVGRDRRGVRAMTARLVQLCRWRPRSSRSPDRPASTRTSSIRWRTTSRRRTATARASSSRTA